MGIAIWGTGVALGPDVIDNQHVASLLGIEAEWIEQRSGIIERRWGGNTELMATAAARSALRAANVTAADLTQIIVATSTPSAAVPAVAAFVANDLGATGGTFDINAASAGAVYAMAVAAPVAAAGGLVLVIGADAYSRVLNTDDRDTTVLFGDGAGALVVGPGTGRVLSNDQSTLLETLDHAAIPLAGTLTMHGRDVYRAAVTHVPRSIERALAQADLKASDLRAIIAHQANGRILTAIAERLGIEGDRIPSTIRLTGNTSAATVPFTLASCVDKFQAGDVLAFCGFGGGMTVATSIWSWGEATPA